MTDQTPGAWNRWGSDDELGAANLLTPERVLSALRVPRTGRVYPLAQHLRMTGTPRSDTGIAVHLLAQDAGDYATGQVAPIGDGQSVATDYLFLRIHGTTTHVDALGHVWSGQSLYNGHPSSAVGSRGLLRCGIDKLPGIVTRGVLLDIAGWQGRRHLDPGHEISVDELLSCAESEGVDVRAGDAVLLRTGFRSVYAEDPDLYIWEFAGIGLEGARWLADRDVVLVGSDTLGVEVRRRETAWDLPVHLHLLHRHGIYMVELLDLDRLAADGVHEFLFMGAPLPLVGGTGAPISPLAIG